MIALRALAASVLVLLLGGCEGPTSPAMVDGGILGKAQRVLAHARRDLKWRLKLGAHLAPCREGV